MSLWDQLVVRSLPFVPRPLVGYFSRPYIAGQMMDEALKSVHQLNQEGFMATLDILGEGVADVSQTRVTRDEYLQLINRIPERRLDANVSIKLTALGLNLDKGLCLENLRVLVKRAAELNSFIRIDMEDITTTDATLEIHRILAAEFPGHVGVAFQAYLRRSVADAAGLIRMKANIRLCKGIYVEPYAAAYRDPEIIRRNFIELLEMQLKGGMYVGIATHDEILVWESERLIRRLGLGREQYEFQMLLGVAEKLRRTILDAGHRLRVYVPYGQSWYAYSVRRLRENPRLAGLVAQRALGLSPKG
ncbi:MAG: proline dehydrogenase family protein [Candidatus Eisenbacteria bacterium]|uniref:proline dehydrogenase n=1 Tax=Eiseniibacteriota bacterium TaxID=2212470 RepID=A0A948RVV0_UNCEI|nr:proline dehydrogenase family protein [Candidatus Eisenbacteria bacterium]MBU1947225.1 proline dehydrogenase family protein [Candidatus Eisenbacteria bacterium]MBU2690508.1 proline dehydrogenase family protein [Candidatus Eisenbacteria bacterium]